MKSSTKNTSEVWRIINDITNGQKKDNRFPHKLDINKWSFFQRIDIVNKLNSHFTNTGKQTCTKTRSTLILSYNLKISGSVLASLI